ncbi:hypothetical protein [Paraclostridium sordellii]|uniref:hypothetical protein n=3 Tax=Paraclostridium sordellii TaxID=1505 RepID=UPI0005E53863|nr:hypothetical protein [Paeniclostridium sordellii]CEP40433.1 Uncharacterised protein [[Clostridium] sordellii] [Paeniclostridium sordellii]
MKLDLYKSIKNLDEKKQHEKFLLLKNEIQLCHEKKILNDWTEGMIDRDKKFVREFQETFHSSFWEIYLYKLFRKANFELDQTHQMPDFIIKSPIEFYVEAVVSNIKNNGRKEKERSFEDIISMAELPHSQEDFYSVLDEAIIRAASAIKSKNEKFKNEYVNRDWINPDKPFTIAMGSYDQVNYGREYIYPMLALLYGMYFDVNSENFIKKDKVIKEETQANIPIGIFFNNEYEDVSAVIYSCTMTIGKLTSLSISEGNQSCNSVYNIRKNYNNNKYLLHIVDGDNPEDLADGVFVFHNPNAKNKLPDSVFEGINVTQFFYENRQLYYKGNEAPIVSRVNINKCLAQGFEMLLMGNIMGYNRI